MAKLANAPVALIIMDGYGCGDVNDPNNAVQIAKTPVIDGLKANFKNTQIFASGEHVGLPDGQMGNSEVGHTNIGAGRIIYQSLTLTSGSLEEEAVLRPFPCQAGGLAPASPAPPFFSGRRGTSREER